MCQITSVDLILLRCQLVKIVEIKRRKSTHLTKFHLTQNGSRTLFLSNTIFTIFGALFTLYTQTSVCTFINAQCFLPILIPRLNIDIRNWSQDMCVLKGGKLEKQRSPLIRTEIKVSSAILVYVFTLTCIKVKLIGVRIMHKARI